MHDRFQIHCLPQEYINYVTDSLPANIDEPYTMNNSAISTFLRDYFDCNAKQG